MYLARRHPTDASLREVAQRLRVRDISTVSHGEKRITMSLQENTPTAKEAKRILVQAYSLIQACRVGESAPDKADSFNPEVCAEKGQGGPSFLLQGCETRGAGFSDSTEVGKTQPAKWAIY
jgi:hypothetical protein